jgi:hypothetical protein
MKIRPVGAGVVPCGQTYGRTYVTNLVVTYRNFANAPRKDGVLTQDGGS